MFPIEQSTRVHVPAAEIFKEIPKYFGILPRVLSFFLPGRHRPADISFLIIFYRLRYFGEKLLREKTCTLVKREGDLPCFREEPHE